MNCDRCGWLCSAAPRSTKVSGYKVDRVRHCKNCGHTFRTIEIHVRFNTISKERWTAMVLTVEKRVAAYWRDVEIAQELHKGWNALAEKFCITKSGVYLAAQRGRAYLKGRK